MFLLQLAGQHTEHQVHQVVAPPLLMVHQAVALLLVLVVARVEGGDMEVDTKKNFSIIVFNKKLEYVLF